MRVLKLRFYLQWLFCSGRKVLRPGRFFAKKDLQGHDNFLQHNDTMSATTSVQQRREC
jgi:hypothetical protein